MKICATAGLIIGFSEISTKTRRKPVSHTAFTSLVITTRTCPTYAPTRAVPNGRPARSRIKEPTYRGVKANSLPLFPLRPAGCCRGDGGWPESALAGVYTRCKWRLTKTGGQSCHTGPTSRSSGHSLTHAVPQICDLSSNTDPRQ